MGEEGTQILPGCGLLTWQREQWLPQHHPFGDAALALPWVAVLSGIENHQK